MKTHIMANIRPPTADEYQPYVENREHKHQGLVNAAMGIGGLALAGMAFNLKRRGTKFAPSLYLIHTRLVVQGSILTLLCGAMGYKIFE